MLPSTRRADFRATGACSRRRGHGELFARHQPLRVAFLEFVPLALVPLLMTALWGAGFAAGCRPSAAARPKAGDGRPYRARRVRVSVPPRWSGLACCAAAAGSWTSRLSQAARGFGARLGAGFGAALCGASFGGAGFGIGWVGVFSLMTFVPRRFRRRGRWLAAVATGAASAARAGAPATCSSPTCSTCGRRDRLFLNRRGRRRRRGLFNIDLGRLRGLRGGRRSQFDHLGLRLAPAAAAVVGLAAQAATFSRRRRGLASAA